MPHRRPRGATCVRQVVAEFPIAEWRWRKTCIVTAPVLSRPTHSPPRCLDLPVSEPDERHGLGAHVPERRCWGQWELVTDRPRVQVGSAALHGKGPVRARLAVGERLLSP
eukprot:CAMPEP_0119514290 /NCGR_PEP_ID=MMETSP1344-20130328/32156_1 /TAXON_ID=236787 /ORGANISM="Florenciella parvula, Strain CCMP2471" /LENGTH=109 /DNA_ID=CAMNT_0007551607 /DNA_START=246 /DNA_END=575 /DNA_ORIENTATION=+